MILFVDSILREIKMKDINSSIKGDRIHLKSLAGAKSKQLNYK